MSSRDSASEQTESGSSEFLTPPASAELEGALRAAGDAESLPMRLALARMRQRLFDVSTEPTRLGRFELRQVIGRGATATVHTAFDPRLRRVVALKVFAPNLDAGTAARVQREARLAATFSHPNIVTVLDVGVTGGRIWVAMERVEGQTLREFLPGTESRWQTLAPVFLPIAEALHEVHRQGIVHRDVKPENILVDAEGRVMLTDFGVATVGPMTADAGAGGTPAYMSPEQIEGAEVGPASDQFSFCVALFEALEGRRPFAADASAARFEAIRQGPDAALSGTSMPKSVRGALARGLRLEPDERFASMRELAQALGLRRSCRVYLALGIGGAVAIAMAVAGSGGDPVNCDGAGAEVRSAWEPRRAEIDAAFVAGPEAFVIEGGSRVVSNLDAYVDELAAARVAVCEAVGRRTLAASVAEGRVQCLEQRERELERFVDSMRDAKARKGAISQSYSLRRIESCRTAPKAPSIPKTMQAEYDAVERELDALRDGDDFASLQARIAKAEEAVARAQALGHRPLSIRAQTALGNARDTAGDPQGALEMWEGVYFSARQQGMPTQSFELATAVIGALAKLGRFDDAQAWVRHARAAKGRAPGPLAHSRIDQAEATVLLMLERPTGALPLLEGALERRRGVLGEEHPLVAATHLEIGNAHLSLGDFDRALVELETARTIYEAALGAAHPNLAVIDNNLGAVQFQLGRIDDAIEYWKRALAIRAAAQPGPDRSAHGTLTNLAKAAATKEDWQQAEAFVTEALEIWDAVGLGDDHPELAGTLEVQAETLLRRGAADEAYRASVRAIEICDAVYGKVDIPTLGPLSIATRAAWELGNAEATVQHAERFVGSPSSELFGAPTRAGIAWLYAQALSATGEAQGARQQAERALELYRSTDDADATRALTEWLRLH
ncbi:MAG: serine/threonine-protein kinase [Myxococcota bacterium]